MCSLGRLSGGRAHQQATGTGATGGSFAGGYAVGTHTSASVTWNSAVQTTGASVTFPITVYVAVGTIGSGSLSDTATLRIAEVQVVNVVTPES